MEETNLEEIAEWEFAQALAAIAREDTLSALPHIEKALQLHNVPEWSSYLGLCIARERGHHRKGLELCQLSLAADPENPAHFLNMAKILLVKGDKSEALRILREGMAHGGGPELLQQLERLGKRHRSIIPALARSNPFNRYLGIFLKRVGLRR